MLTYQDIRETYASHFAGEKGERGDKEEYCCHTVVDQFGPTLLYVHPVKDDAPKGVENALGKQMVAMQDHTRQLVKRLTAHQIAVTNIVHDFGSYRSGQMLFVGVYVFLAEPLPAEPATAPSPLRF